MQLFIDTNIPMYWAGEDSPFKAACGRVFSAIDAGEVEAVTDCEVFQEIFHRYTAIGKPDIARMVFDTFYKAVHVVLPVAKRDVLLARELHESYNVKSRDLVHAAVMLNAGIADICSVDLHFDQIKGIRRIDPRNFATSD